MNSDRPQKTSFLRDEGDAWLDRNLDSLRKRDYSQDPIIQSIYKISHSYPLIRPLKILEIGCGDGGRLAAIQKKIDCKCYGVDPSSKAIEIANSLGVVGSIGVADSLAFESSTFDIVIFGFCLYLCDREDLFTIASEADRVLKKESWLIIHDFYSHEFSSREYKHKKDIKSYKMDYRSLFEWNPFYTCYSHSITKHGDSTYTDDADEWVALSILRKCIPKNGQ